MSETPTPTDSRSDEELAIDNAGSFAAYDQKTLNELRAHAAPNSSKKDTPLSQKPDQTPNTIVPENPSAITEGDIDSLAGAAMDITTLPPEQQTEFQNKFNQLPEPIQDRVRTELVTRIKEKAKPAELKLEETRQGVLEAAGSIMQVSDQLERRVPGYQGPRVLNPNQRGAAEELARKIQLNTESPSGQTPDYQKLQTEVLDLLKVLGVVKQNEESAYAYTQQLPNEVVREFLVTKAAGKKLFENNKALQESVTTLTTLWKNPVVNTQAKPQWLR